MRGGAVLPALLERFQPATVLASTAGGEIRFEGLLTQLLWQKGSVQEAAVMMPEGVRLIDPVPGARLTIKGLGAAAR